MFRMFKTGMNIMGDAESALYAEPSSMAQVYDMMYAGACDIGLLPLRSMKDEEGDGQSLPAGENGVAEENTFLQGLLKSGLRHSCAHMLEDTYAGAPNV